jgi:hypothetical protein
VLAGGGGPPEDRVGLGQERPGAERRQQAAGGLEPGPALRPAEGEEAAAGAEQSLGLFQLVAVAGQRAAASS